MSDDSTIPRWDEYREQLRSSSESIDQVDGTTNEVVVFHDQRGKAFVLKRYRSPRAYRREKHALQEWAPKIAAYCPRVVANFPHDGPALLLSRVPGDRIFQSNVAPACLAEESGRILRQLHNLGLEVVDTLDPREAIGVRLDDARRRSSVWLGARERCFLDQIARDISQLPSRPRVVCHGDYVHRNWLWCRDTSQLGVLDFENSRPDIAEFDFLKLHMESWCREPSLRRNFFEGYGSPWTEENEAWIHILEALYRLGTVNWMEQSGDSLALVRAQEEFAALVLGSKSC